MCQKLNTTFGSNSEHLPVFRALRWADREESAGTIHKSNPEHLLVLKLHAGRSTSPIWKTIFSHFHLFSLISSLFLARHFETFPSISFHFQLCPAISSHFKQLSAISSHIQKTTALFSIFQPFQAVQASFQQSTAYFSKTRRGRPVDNRPSTD